MHTIIFSFLSAAATKILHRHKSFRYIPLDVDNSHNSNRNIWKLEIEVDTKTVNEISRETRRHSGLQKSYHPPGLWEHENFVYQQEL